MSEPIKVGDLVMVVRPKSCGCADNQIGTVHVVSGFYASCHCPSCKIHHYQNSAMLDGKWFAIPVSRLKRIDPPAIGDSLPTLKTIKEPA